MSGTEDFYWRTRTPADRDSVRRAAVARRAERNSALLGWLDGKIPHLPSPSKPSLDEQKPGLEMEGDVKPEAPRVVEPSDVLE